MFNLRAEHSDPIHEMCGASLHEADLLAFAQRTINHPDEDDDAKIWVVPAIDEHCLQRSFPVAPRRRDLVDNRLENFVDPETRLGTGKHGLGSVEPDDLLNFLPDALLPTFLIGRRTRLSTDVGRRCECSVLEMELRLVRIRPKVV